MIVNERTVECIYRNWNSGKWFFVDETWQNSSDFDTFAECYESLEKYCESL